ncbi:MAG: metallophosphoesterase [Oscillospiraceae bacterium]|nr:metallophosphoesterase [Oscillospiraceae bacterium]
MSLYAIGDLHLHFQSELKIGHPQRKDKAWKNHEEKFRKNCAKLLTNDDTLVLVGDHSWGKNLDSCEADLRYIAGLPGRKILTRGNHDMFWDAKKTAALNERYAGRLEFLQNNYYAYEDYALVGTKGFTFEGPFYLDRRGRIVGWDEKNEEHAKKIVAREAERLRISFEAAKADGYRRFVMFLHYPPTSILEDESRFTRIAEEYRAEQVVYAHSHGESRFYDSVLGEKNGVYYRLVSGDFLKWMPVKILD